ncbi:MAG: type II toxin-antitoxin system VapC family toxin [Pyrinomonadaceae bacterium]|nr:type II toxin-antitoxin system VapC family toxin [Pyrinomonadaceae bacterium]
MKILIDTHIFLWMFLTPSRISANVSALLKNSNNDLFLSSASSLEIAIKYRIGKLKLPDSPEIYVPDRINRANLKSLDITQRHALAITDLPQIHKDPFDRLLITQANIENFKLLSADRVFDLYGLDFIDANKY